MQLKINKIIDTGFIGYVSYIYQKKTITLPMAYGRKENKVYFTQLTREQNDK